MLLRPVNLLVLDEPTNHLDLATKDILLEALSRYKGTLVFVSHDHHFIQGLATRVLEIDDGGTTDYPGDYEYYLYRVRGGEQMGTSDTDEELRAAIRSAAGAAPASRLARHAVKETERKRRKLKREEETVMDRLAVLEEQKASMDGEMSRQEVYTDGERMRDLRERERRNQEEQNRLHARWEELERELSGLDGPGEG
jgi:ATP-binding cassette subfamily F protein 3